MGLHINIDVPGAEFPGASWGVGGHPGQGQGLSSFSGEVELVESC